MVKCRDCKFGSWVAQDSHFKDAWGECRFRFPAPIAASLAQVGVDISNYRSVRNDDTCDAGEVDA